MDPDRLARKLEAAGCIRTSAGVIAVDSQRLILSFLNALKRIEELEEELRAVTGAVKP
jgi:hypothetical protein